MFIDDLAHSFLRLEQFKRILNQLSQKQEKAIKRMNQEIYVTDVVIRVPFEPFGESSFHSNRYQHSQEQRLRDHIAMLFSLANEIHSKNQKKANPLEDPVMNRDRENHITRLTTHEFSLYTKKPMTLLEFQNLFSQIEVLGSHLLPNVHVLLSSFAIQNKDGRLLNLCLFVEGGSPCIIHAFSKNTASLKDMDYNGKMPLFSQQEQDKGASFHAEAIVLEDGTTISTGSVFEVKTQGGAKYTQCVDICIDHAFQHSKELMLRRLFSDANNDELLPYQIEQCISSNTSDLFVDSMLGNGFIHADPSVSMESYLDHEEKALDDTEINRIIPQGYQNIMKIIHYAGGYQLINPAFGSNCIIEIFKARPVGQYQSDLLPAVEKHNRNVCEKQIENLKQEYFGKSEADKLALHIDQTNQLAKRLEQLEKTMIARCKPVLLQGLFKTEEYQQKIAAKEIIISSMKLMKDAIKAKGNSSVILIRAWKKELEAKLNCIGSLDVISPLKRAFKKDIKDIIELQLQQDLGCQFEKDGEQSMSASLSNYPSD